MTGPDPMPRVIATPSTLALIAELTARHGPVLFHQSGGCCDGSAPMCFPQADFVVSPDDVCLGIIGGAPFHIGASQFEYWRHTQLVIDVVAGIGGMFSLDNGTGLRFHVRSRLFPTEDAAATVAAAAPAPQACRRAEAPLFETHHNTRNS
ncbi:MULTISPECIES: DUF779 domain-containing protein [unclassified Acidiphilium]|uniref:DUF779 domain-containing protein n=1 Tax=unclassified Acidiphilium TaxID=2617493 RepID=UPI000BD0AB2A|nr:MULTISPECIES: DUF779 domain-containing protein [unclassified Acidiphilium]OYV54387.1 MAG: acetaldehyde dehydrogenase [Acidiphilium sp. 20-67-58]HQT62578.1 DUF779 domain-containing protein [Acidiphilium sp.]